MAKRGRKKQAEKSLVVFDLDNTFTDTLKCWATATREVVRLMPLAFGIDEQDLLQAMRRAPSQYRFSDFAGLLSWLEHEKILPQTENAAEHYREEAIKNHLCNVWHHHQKKLSTFYPGTIEELRDIKAQKTAMALYTDSDAPSMVARMWLLACSAVKEKTLSDQMQLAEMFDHYYCQPSIVDDYSFLKNVDPDFIHLMKKRMTIWQDRIYKPSTDHLLMIMEDFNADPKTTLMVGDTSKDTGSARPLGVDAAWCSFGTDIDDETIKTAQSVASPLFQYGRAAITACFNKINKPSHTLKNDLSELKLHFRFVPGNPFTEQDHNGRSLPAYPHSGVDPALRNRSLKRVWPDSHVHTRSMPLGPATHLPPVPPAPGPVNPNDKADQETQGSPAKPQPV
jgi:FMN phosphatase YigB (HAD superfamily)